MIKKRKYNVAIVDDIEMAVIGMKFFLKTLPNVNNVYEYSNFENIILDLQSKKINPDLIFCDIVIKSGMSGIDFCKWLEFQNSTIPALILTAQDLTLSKCSDVYKHLKDVLNKPIGVKELENKVLEFLK